MQRLKWELVLRNTEAVQREKDGETTHSALKAKVKELDEALEGHRKAEKDLILSRQDDYSNDI